MPAHRCRRVIEVLGKLISVHCAPRYLRSDSGPEFVARAVLQWLCEEGIHTAVIDPAKPWQNRTKESSNGKFRDECLSMECFRSPAEARVVIETFQRHYTAVRPQSSLGRLTSNEFKRQLDQKENARTEIMF